MRKSFKRALAAVLAVLMVVCAFPMTAMAAPGDYEPNIDLQFGTFFGLNYATWNDYPDFEDGDTSNKQDDWNGCNGLFGPVLQYDKNAGTLTLTAASTEGYEDVWGVAPLDADYTYGVGDYFTITVLLENVSAAWCVEGYIKHSDNITPAGVWSTSGAARNRVYYVGTQAECDDFGSASIEVHPAGVPISSMSAESFHDMNVEIGNDSDVDADTNIIHFSAVNQSGNDTVDISSVSNDGTGYEFANPETGAAPDYDGGDGYDYTNTAILCTFAFKITGEGAITFEVDDPDNSSYNAYSGFYYVAAMSDGTDPSTFTTYAIQEGSAGSAKMTFMGKNVNVAEEECTHANTTTTENVTAQATCDTAGSKTVTVTCNDCGEVVSTTTVEIPALGHKYDAVVTAPTCTDAGYTTYTCSVCGDAYVGDEVAALGHTPAAAVVENNVAATCTTPGSYDNVVYCSVCGTEISRETVTVPVIAHTPADAVVENEVAASCGADGSYDNVVYCSVCGTEISRDTVTVPATGAHVYATEVDRKDATCTEDGYVVMACACGAEQTTAIPALGHTPAEAVVENEVAATCTTPGSYDTVVYCSVCKVELSRETTTVPVIAHTPVTDAAVAPTCTDTGLTEGSHCSVCGTVLEAQEEVPALGHSPAQAVVENEVAADCDTDGSYDSVVYCSVCGEELSRDTVTVPALGHKYDAVVTAPTCTEAGYTTYTCSVCGDAYVGDEVPALGHTPAEAVQENVVNATCGTDGSYESVVYCSVCGVEISRETVTVPATGEHVYATEVDRKDATCTEDGYVTMACGCGAEQTTAIPALGHTEAEAVTENEVAATCTTPGSYDTVVYCSVCNEELSRETTTVPVIAHTPVTDAAVAPTCTATGLTEGSHCSVCGTVLEAQEEVPALGHTPAEAVQENVVNATCGTDGSYDSVVYCSVCGVELSRDTVVVPATGEHVYATEVDRKDATCTEDGYVVMACGCGAEQTTAIPALGHTEAEAVTENEVAATCTTDGSYDTVVYCSVCNEELSRETTTVPALGHTEVTVPGYAATVDAPGLTDGVKCSVCNEWIVPQEEIPMLDSVIVTVIEPDLGSVAGLAYGDNKLAMATAYTLTAEALEGAEFLGWAINGKIVSTSSTYTSNAVNDVTIEAMFAETEGSDAITVTFLDKWGNVVATYNGAVADVQAQLAAGIPTASDIVGYTFAGWDMADEDILALTTSATIWAQYEVKADGYTVTTDAELTLPDGVANGAIPYDTSVTVYAEGATAWKIGDVVVAYGDTYTFYVGADVTVVPVFEAVATAPSVTMIKVTETGTNAFQFLATRNVPDGYKLVNAGFVYGRDMAAEELTLDNVGTKAASGYTVKVGYCSVNGADQFALNYKVSSDSANACAKAFVVYKDAAGAVNVIYTDMFIG